MKKMLMVLLMVMLSVGLMACGGEKETASNDGETKVDAKEKPKEEKKDDENVEESEIGKMTTEYKDGEIKSELESGPMKLTITGLKVGTLEPSGEYKDMFEGKDKLTVITLRMKTENTSDDTLSFYPDQATITTNTGDQVEADMMLSDSIGGDFIGKVNKEGNVIFTLDAAASDVETVNLIVSAAHDENIDDVGEEIKATFEIK